MKEEEPKSFRSAGRGRYNFWQSAGGELFEPTEYLFVVHISGLTRHEIQVAAQIKWAREVCTPFAWSHQSHSHGWPLLTG
jgi:hypothetical protein